MLDVFMADHQVSRAGYSAPVTGKTAEERLDLRCAVKVCLRI
jgi:hypothetical protein